MNLCPMDTLAGLGIDDVGRAKTIFVSDIEEAFDLHIPCDPSTSGLAATAPSALPALRDPTA